jgi:hypothetical protein
MRLTSMGVPYPLGMGLFLGVTGEMLYLDVVEVGFDEVVEGVAGDGIVSQQV